MNKSLRQQYLKEIGIQNWQLRSNPDEFISELKVETEECISLPVESPHIQPAGIFSAKEEAEIHPEIIIHKSIPNEEDSASLIPPQPLFNASLINSIESCILCSSRKNRLKALSGEGYAEADVFFISEVPNAEEQRDGHYLTGEIQSLFTKMLDAIGISNNYFFTGLVKCHSFQNYLITEDEINNCHSHLIAQLEQLKPKVLVLLGKIQAQSLLKTNETFNRLRNKVHVVDINNQHYQAIVSYHPAYLLRNPLHKKEALKDLILIKSLIE